jgi:hypothetical protein
MRKIIRNYSPYGVRIVFFTESVERRAEITQLYTETGREGDTLKIAYSREFLSLLFSGNQVQEVDTR